MFFYLKDLSHGIFETVGLVGIGGGGGGVWGV
jgi:hypothetical protein